MSTILQRIENEYAIQKRTIKFPRLKKPKSSYDFVKNFIKFGYWKEKGAITDRPYDKMVFIDDRSQTEWVFVPDNTRVDVTRLLASANDEKEEEAIQCLSIVVSRICLVLKHELGDEYNQGIAECIFKEVSKRMNILS